MAKMLVMISHPPPKIERPLSINNSCGGLQCYIAMNCIVLFLNPVLHGQSLQSVLVYNFTNMHAMSYRSDLFTSSSGVNSWEPAVCDTVTWLSPVLQVGLASFLILTAISDSKSLNSTSLDVIISFKNERIFIRDWSDNTLHINFDVWWASMNVGSKRPFSWNNSRHTPSWRF